METFRDVILDAAMELSLSGEVLASTYESVPRQSLRYDRAVEIVLRILGTDIRPLDWTIDRLERHPLLVELCLMRHLSPAILASCTLVVLAEATACAVHDLLNEDEAATHCPDITDNVELQMQFLREAIGIFQEHMGIRLMN